MANKCKDISFTYSINRLSETARTFRNLGDAYENATFCDTEGPSFKKQLFLVADILDDCVAMNLRTKQPDKEFKREFIKRCFIAGIRVKNITLVVGKNGMKELTFMAKTLVRGCIPERKLRKIVSELSDYEFFSNENNRMIINEEYKQYIFYQEDRFRILSGVARKSKNKDIPSGDNFLMQKISGGKMITAIADGCGSGKKAFTESRMVIELMENCIDAGLEEKTAIDLINSAYVSGRGYDNPVTMDMSIIDCQAGVLNCIKLGAASTFIKREGWVEIIKSTTLPIGVLEQVDYDSSSKKLYDGDYIIMMSDGLLDNLPVVNKEEMMVEIINSITTHNPKNIANEILEKSLQMHDMEAFDDCTVIVLGVFDTYENR